MSLSGDKGVAQFKKSVKMGHPIIYRLYKTLSRVDWTDVTNNQKAPLGSLVMVLELNIGFESVAGHQLSDGYLETSFHLALCFYGSVP